MESVLNRPQYTVTPGPSLAGMETGLKRWSEAKPQFLAVETMGHSPIGLPVLLCRITDQSVSNDDKQVALFTTNHTGLERNAASTALKLVKYLIGDDPLAAEIRRKQIVLVMPACEPDTYDSKSTETSNYYRSRTGKVYGGWTWDGPEDPDNQPEAMAVKSVMDQYQPEVHQDVHGIWFQEASMWESTGVSWASNIYRSYAPQVARLMNKAAEEGGFLITGAEEAAGQILATMPVEGAEHWFYGAHSKPSVVAGLYAYRQYHTLAQTCEVGWEQSALIRYRRLLQIGNEVWRGEHYTGYPVNQMGCWTSTAIAAWGTNASERRKSRVEIWQKLPQLSFTCAHPEPRNSVAAFVATTSEARTRYTSDTNLETVIARLKTDVRFDGEGLDEYLCQSPAHNVLFHPQNDMVRTERIENGLAIRLLLPHRRVSFKHLKLDGHDISPSETDGYIEYHNPGTIVQVNIPPGKVQDFHVVTGIFDPPSDRPAGFSPEDWEL